MIKKTAAFKNTPEDIDRASDLTWQWLKESNVNRKTALKTKLALEGVLLNLHENASGSEEFKVSSGYRLWQYVIVVEFEGDRYDPLDTSDIEENSFLFQLMQTMDLVPSYSYKKGINQVTFNIEKRRIRSEAYIIAAVLLAVIFGLLGNYIPQNIMDGIRDYGLDLVSNTFSNLLSTFSGFMIFFILISGICGTGSISDFNKIGRSIFRIFIGSSVAGAALMTVLALPLFDLTWGDTVEHTSAADQLYEVIVNIIPSNPIKPFYDGNMMQIVFLALFIGVVILVLEGRVDSVKRFIGEVNILITKAVNIICVMLPLFIFTSLLSVFWDMGFSEIISMWKPILISIVLGLTYPVILLIYISVRYKLSPFLILKRISKSLISALTTASSIASFQTIRDDLTKGLGIDEKLVDLAYPIGMQLNNANYLLIYLLPVLTIAEDYRTPVSFVWVFMASIFSIVFATATPCVSGGTLICIGIMMENLSIPNNSLALAGTLSIILDFILTMDRVFLQELELYLMAKKYNMLDESVLH